MQIYHANNTNIISASCQLPSGKSWDTLAHLDNLLQGSLFFADDRLQKFWRKFFFFCVRQPEQFVLAHANTADFATTSEKYKYTALYLE